MALTNFVYVLPQAAILAPHVIVALDQLRPMADRLVLVVPGGDLDRCKADFAAYDPTMVLPMPEGPQTTAAGYKAGMTAIWAADAAAGVATGATILTGVHVAGPICPPDPALLQAQTGLFSAYWYGASLDPRLQYFTKAARLPLLDFAVVSSGLMQAPEFRQFWTELKIHGDYWHSFVNLEVRLAERLLAMDETVTYPAGTEAFQTMDPRHHEIDKVVQSGMPCFPLSIFTLDPLLHDLNSINLRGALDALRPMHPALYAAVINFVTRAVPMRDFATIADQYEILPVEARSPGKTAWSFGRIAVFIHAFYAEMMPEFWDLLQQLPCDHDLFLTTSTEAHKAEIEAFLADKGFPADRTEVRVVDQNRGRDMSSLFITFRDVALSDRYPVALRLHSKRTPQVSRQVGEGFKKHLFDNLVKSPGYVGNILDLFEQQPDIGMVMPPVIHVGFGTLGHSWFNNRGTLHQLSLDMGLNVPFDADTPVAAYGTMYWFRPAAMWKMFKWEWKWEDYNSEPHHIDGGLAHVQERLIGYCVQDAGFRIVQVMNPDLAARYYAKLEYKLQLLAARLMSGNILQQRDQLDHLGAQGRARTFRWMTGVYGSILQKFPASRGMLRPIARFVVRVIAPRP
ncbi:MAG: rhamnan synthesis F family protein [Pseudomonadota bacterium]